MTSAADPIIPLTAADLDASPPLAAALLKLNNDHAIELSPLDPARLRAMVAASFLAARIGDIDAFLLAFDQDAAYDSPNFLWFRDRVPRFVYIDRVVVAARARGIGHSRRLYTDLGVRALAAGHPRIFCEVNAVPPNPASDAFHARLGFETVGIATLPGGKVVRYLALDAVALAGASS